MPFRWQVIIFCFCMIWASGFPARNSLMIPSSVIIPVGELRKLSILGFNPDNLKVRVENPEVCSLVSSTAPYILKGMSPGKTKVEITSGKLTRATRVTVIAHAGYIPKEASLVVTGDRVSMAFLRTELAKILDEKIVRKEGAFIKVTLASNKLPSALGPGEEFRIPVVASISGKNYLTSKGTINLSVKNEPLVLNSISRLMVSNNPESFKRPQTLFKEQLLDDSPVRVFYHHANKGNVPYLFEVVLENTSGSPTAVHVIEGSAGSDPHELLVGASAAARFFGALKHELGKVVEVDSGGGYTLIRTKVEPGGVVSGILRLSPLDANRPTVMVRARALHGEDKQEADADMGIEKGNKCRGIFESPEIVMDSEYTVGGDYAFMTIGKDFLLRELNTAKPDLGNYGVSYVIHLALKNPTASPAPVHVMFTPEAGPAKGIFLIDERTLVETPTVAAFQPYSLLAVELKPGETRNVVLRTMPVGGSFYPVKIVAQP